jgi:small-conductance mechanosensitive channel
MESINRSVPNYQRKVRSKIGEPITLLLVKVLFFLTFLIYLTLWTELDQMNVNVVSVWSSVNLCLAVVYNGVLLERQ